MTEYPYLLFNKSPEQMRQLGACGGRAYGPSTCWTPSFRGCAVRKGNAPEIGSGSPRPLRARIETSAAGGDRTRTSAWIPATTARRAGGGVRLPAGRLRAFWIGVNPRRASLLSTATPQSTSTLSARKPPSSISAVSKSAPAKPTASPSRTSTSPSPPPPAQPPAVRWPSAYSTRNAIEGSILTALRAGI
jgi:hypothetical protein